MKRGKPRGRVPSLIGSTSGKPKRVLVQRQSKCYRCHAVLVKGQTCIEIPKPKEAFSTSKRVCDECYQEIWKRTFEDLDALRAI